MTTDQRGTGRGASGQGQGGRCDIGAFELPAVQFSSGTYSVSEAAPSATLTATLDFVSALDVTVRYTATSGTATAGVDFTAVSDTLTFPAFTTSRTFSVPIIDDSTYELTETVSLLLGSPISGAMLDTPGAATLSIIDDDPPPAVNFASTTYNVDENAGPAVITATLTNPSAFTTMVQFATSNGTAIAGSDYTAKSGTLSFAPMQTSNAFTVTITDDNIFEGDETVNLTLSEPVISGTLGLTNTATLTILDNEIKPTVGFSASTYNVNENAGPALITVTLSHPSAFTTTVNVQTSNGTATAGSDYSAITQPLTFTPNVTLQTFTIPIINDNMFEGDETVNLSLNLTSSTMSATVGVNSAVMTILDNESAPAVGFSSSAYSVNENSGPAVITVNLSHPSAFTTTVNYATSNGTAIAGSDYLTATGTLTYTPGNTSQTFNVPIINDSVYKGSRTVNLSLSAPAPPLSATLGLSSAVLTIVDDEPPPVAVRFSSSTYSVNEGAGPAVITVTLSGPSAFTVTVNYTTSDGTAQAGSDYVAASGLLTFVPGNTLQTFPVSVINDAVYKGNRSLTLGLTNPTGASLGSPGQATLTIVDNDPPPPLFLPMVMNNFSLFFLGPCEAEPNNSSAQANGPLISGQDYCGYPNDQWDVYSLTTRSAGQITVNLTLPANYKGQGTQLQLLFSGQLVGYAGGAPFHIVHNGPAGQYFIAIYSAAFDNTVPYTLRVTYP